MKKTDKLAESYRILGVSPGASLQQVKKIFHHKALLYHPDANPGATAAAAEFKNITRAYGIIRAHLQKQAAETRHATDGFGAPARNSEQPAARNQAADCDPFNLSKALSAKHQAPVDRSSTGSRNATGECAREPAGLRAALKQFRNRKLQERDAQVGELALRLPFEELGFRLEHSDNPYVRMHAVRALAVQGGKPAAWLIIRALADQDERVARAAAEALGALRTRAASMPLIRLHQKSSPEIKRIIQTALERIDSPLARRFLESLNTGQDHATAQKQSTDIA